MKSVTEWLPLSPALQEFIAEHAHAEPAALMLQTHRFPEIPMAFAVQQIEARKKLKIKVPSWASNPSLAFPPKVSVEQASSELTAQYKASLVQGASLADLTGGMGIDSFYFSQTVPKVFYVEQNPDLCRLAQHNFSVLGANTISVVHQEATDFLQNTAERFSVCYLDPSRRDAHQNRLFLLEECEPNLVTHYALFAEKAAMVLVKVSPMVDLKEVAGKFPSLHEIHILSVGNDCKEVLLLFREAPPQALQIKCVLLQAEQPAQIMAFEPIHPKLYPFTWSRPQSFIYEPDVAVMKAGGMGAFAALAAQFQLAKLHPNSHLFTSEKRLENFPGRTFRCQQSVPFQKKKWKKLGIAQCNLTVRNFPLSVQEIRLKTKWKEGGNLYVFATTLTDDAKALLLCERI